MWSLVGERSLDALHELVGLERLGEHRVARVASVARDSVPGHEHDSQAGLSSDKRLGNFVAVVRTENDVDQREVVASVLECRSRGVPSLASVAVYPADSSMRTISGPTAGSSSRTRMFARRSDSVMSC